MRISLCVICGNEQHHIGRMLDSFGPAFDELSLVRAIGSRKPDATLSIARDWCENNGKRFIFSEHQNQYGAEKWEHVDSFGEARNDSFRQGTGDWLIWADCDDIMDGADHLRETLAGVAAEVAMVRFLYDVRGTNKKLYRERAMRRASFHAGRKWHHDVHENLLLLAGDKHQDLNDPVWVHAPLEVKRENRTRNLRILRNSVRDTAAQYFYLHQEHYCSGNYKAAEEFAKIALSMPNLMDSFKYEALLNLARCCGNHRDAIRYCLEAHGVFPWCREALTSLVLLYFEKQDRERAFYWAEQALLRPEPPDEIRPWTHEAKHYGWYGIDLAARAARYAGKMDRAAELQSMFHNHSRPTISLIHATRGRSSKAVACRDAFLQSAFNPANVEHIFCVDLDDEVSMEMSQQFEHVVSDQRSCVAAWNKGARKASGDLIIQLSDDWLPPLHWDLRLLELVASRDLAKEEVVIAINDGARKDSLLCMAIMSRGRWEKQGDMFFAGYESVFSDDEFSHRAWNDGVVIDARDRITFVHAHPQFGHGQLDATYQHNNQSERYKRGRALFQLRNPDAVTKEAS
jgi:glycosyltransferase involved in cell wall biosynthesis